METATKISQFEVHQATQRTSTGSEMSGKVLGVEDAVKLREMLGSHRLKFLGRVTGVGEATYPDFNHLESDHMIGENASKGRALSEAAGLGASVLFYDTPRTEDSSFAWDKIVTTGKAYTLIEKAS